MKTINMLVLMLLTTLSMNLNADPVTRYAGEFAIDPQPPHTAQITGKMMLNFEQENLVQVHLFTDQSVFGKKELVSSTQWMNVATNAEINQIGVAYKLQGTPHKWFFVMVGHSKDGGKTYETHYFSVNQDLPQIQKILADVLTKTPGGWNEVGHGALNLLLESME